MECLANKSLVANLAREIATAQEELPIGECRTDTVSALAIAHTPHPFLPKILPRNCHLETLFHSGYHPATECSAI